ncbi:uncharacterized protein LOC113755698 [Coffea eugenioides]|uniref:uncharacterized protein LOC113755698 n=1 Tax=Coffea eugenioides TaxID=49369 RepID=UPI000F605741|nr:uncharacterized protein LOC113755698 [Coffea eugenioides]
MDFLEVYQRDSGQGINTDKSFYIPSARCSTAQKRLITRLTGFRQQQLPFTYLSCRLYKGRAKMEYYQPLINIMQRKFAGWKNRMLSVGGRLILIKHVLAVIPQYTFAVQEPPKTIIHQIRQIMARLFWGEAEGREKWHWKNWNALCHPTVHNGLGL